MASCMAAPSKMAYGQGPLSQSSAHTVASISIFSLALLWLSFACIMAILPIIPFIIVRLFWFSF